MDRSTHASSFSFQGSVTEMEFQDLFCPSLDYMVEKLGTDDGKLDSLCNLLHKNDGTSMAGSVASGDEDNLEFVESPRTANGGSSEIFLRQDLIWVWCKPSEEALEQAVRIVDANPHRTVGTSQRCKGAEYALESIHNLRDALPELWEADLKPEAGYSGAFVVDTSATA